MNPLNYSRFFWTLDRAINDYARRYNLQLHEVRWNYAHNYYTLWT